MYVTMPLWEFILIIVIIIMLVVYLTWVSLMFRKFSKMLDEESKDDKGKKNEEH